MFMHCGYDLNDGPKNLRANQDYAFFQKMPACFYI